MGMHINPFLFEEEHLVRQVDRSGEFWFVAADVCRALGIKNVPDAVARLDEDEKGIVTSDTLGGAQDLNVVSEPGVYRLVFTSRKPVAERFKRWLTHEVIPAIRKTGGYGQSKGDDGEVMPDLIEKRPFPDWPMSELTAKRSFVDTMNRVYGSMVAQWYCPQLGFPVPPIELVQHGRQFGLPLGGPDAEGV